MTHPFCHCEEQQRRSNLMPFPHCQTRLVLAIAWGAVCRLTRGLKWGDRTNNLLKAASPGFAGVSSSSPDEVADSAAGGNVAAEREDDID